LPLKSLVFNVLTTPDKDSGLSCLQSACIEGNIETVSAILNYSPDKLDSAIAFSVKIGRNATNFAGKSIYTVLRQQDSKEHKQINGFVEKVTSISNLYPFYIWLQKRDKLSIFVGYLIVSFFFEEVHSLEMQDAVEFFTALHHAAMGGKIKNILRLIELGANVAKENYDQTSAIHLAAERGHTAGCPSPSRAHGADMKKVNYLWCHSSHVSFAKGPPRNNSFAAKVMD
ncbi:hypothetical protein OS493_040344, partial [Desmophyllum pertusum]